MPSSAYGAGSCMSEMSTVVKRGIEGSGEAGLCDGQIEVGAKDTDSLGIQGTFQVLHLLV